MEPITTVVLSGILYDMMKHGVTITASNLKHKLKDWLVDDVKADLIEQQISTLNLTDEMSERAIEKSISACSALLEVIKVIQPSSQTVITQQHSGTGDNIGIINNKH